MGGIAPVSDRWFLTFADVLVRVGLEFIVSTVAGSLAT